ncbi:MAG: GNAT family N-acetyltransferase [Deltaproteobacteria bacterium]|jgi:ribosomal protein S18 acetylase RimI-like enzyme|nr:GNAT family N-acetyltransferase [Deltaproteobacteria bacterium]
MKSPREARRAGNEAAARIIAATLTLISREQSALPPPYSLWTPRMDPGQVREASMLVADGKAQVVWADDSHPARGLLLYRSRIMETRLLGYGSAVLQGPFLVDPDPEARQRKTGYMAEKALEIARARKVRFVSVKTSHDPAVLRGFVDAGFLVAEVSTCLEGPIAGPEEAGTPPRPVGIQVAPTDGQDAGAVLDGLGDLFYDGHHLHGPFLPEDFSGRLWRMVAERDLASRDCPSLVATDQRTGDPVGLAVGTVSGKRANLTILHVSAARRGQGLGRLLLSSLSSLLHERGARTLAAETASWNLPALSLYVSAGMRHTAPLMALHHAS